MGHADEYRGVQSGFQKRNSLAVVSRLGARVACTRSHRQLERPRSGLALRVTNVDPKGPAIVPDVVIPAKAGIHTAALTLDRGPRIKLASPTLRFGMTAAGEASGGFKTIHCVTPDDTPSWRRAPDHSSPRGIRRSFWWTACSHSSVPSRSKARIVRVRSRRAPVTVSVPKF